MMRKEFQDNNNCRFELREIRCSYCGKYTDDLGTCEDITLCSECRKDLEEQSSPKEIAQTMIHIIDGVPFKQRHRKMHLGTGPCWNRPACGKTTPQPVTTNISAVTCKRCLGSRDGLRELAKG